MSERVELSFTEVSDKTLEVMRELGLLLVSVDNEGKPNAMTIGWGFIGIIWMKPVFIVAVRPSRHTYNLLEQTGDFTVNVPAKGLEKAVEYCGTVSGRDVDKFKECKLTPLPSKYVKSPLVEECVIGYECKIIYKFDLEAEKLPSSVLSVCYPSGDYHRLYFGEILRVVVVKDFEKKLPI